MAFTRQVPNDIVRVPSFLVPDARQQVRVVKRFGARAGGPFKIHERTTAMRAEAQAFVDEIKESLALLRRHL